MINNIQTTLGLVVNYSLQPSLGEILALSLAKSWPGSSCSVVPLPYLQPKLPPVETILLASSINEDIPCGGPYSSLPFA